jgi:GNAT superfamily N-acetyltransferase
MVPVHLELRECRPDELPVVIERLDREFVFGKQRSVSLSKRFPNTLSADNVKRIRIAVSDGVILGTLSLRLFDWVAGGQLWRGAMIGMVWVDPRYRGAGIGSKLLASAEQLLQDCSVDFGVLWTGAPAFYERSGWFLSDCGVFGQVGTPQAAGHIPPVACLPVSSADPTWLERLRSHHLSMRVVRRAIDYSTVPLPATGVLCFSAAGNDAAEGFALVGEQGRNGYLYEMVAPPSLWGDLSAAAAGRFDRFYANGYSDEPFTQWLAGNGFVEWLPNCKTMWLRVSDRGNERIIASWQIPYYDWI